MLATASPCPDRLELSQFALGRCTDNEVEAVERHLAECSYCLQSLSSLSPEDTLVQAVCSQKTLPPLLEGDVIEGLIQRLQAYLPQARNEATPSPLEATTDNIEVLPAVAKEEYDFLAAPQQPDELGRLGSYRVLRVLGVGGMGVVFLAEDPRLLRQVALKAMKPRMAVSVSAHDRFLREARATAAIEHDHIVGVYQVDEDRGIPYLAMPVLRGETLEERLRREPALPLAEILRIARETAEGLAAAHAHNLMHRDIKPSNLWVETGSGRIKILDFGLAREVCEDTRLTMEGILVGTPAYMSPEQVHGTNADARCDLFSLGCVLYRLLTGQGPFEGATTTAVLLAVAAHHPKPPRALNPAVPATVSALVMRLLAKNPQDRPQTARAVADELAALEREPTVAQTVPIRRRLWPAFAAALLLLSIGLAALAIIIIRIDTKEKTVKIEVLPSPPPSINPPLSSLALVSNPVPLKEMKAWSMDTRLHRGPVNGLAYRPDGHWLASAGSDGSGRIWEAASGRLVRILLGHTEEVLEVAWAPDGKTLASAGYDGIVRLWDADSGRLVHLLKGHPRKIVQLAWSPKGDTLASAGQDNSIRLWDADSGKLVQTLTSIDPQANGVQALAWSPDGKRLAAGVSRRPVDIWDIASGKRVSDLETVSSDSSAVAWSPDGKTIAFGRTGGDAVRLWNVDAGKLLPRQVACNKLNHIVWSPDSRRLFVGGATGVIWQGEVDSDKPPRAVSTVSNVWTCAADGKTLAFTDYLTSTTHIHQVRPDGVDAKKPFVTIPCYPSPTLAGAVWSPDGATLILRCSLDTTIRQLSTDDGRPKRVRENAGLGTPPALSRNGKRVAGWNQTSVDVWDLDSGQRLMWIEKLTEPPLCLALSPDGQLLAAGMGKSVQIWEVESGKPLHTLSHAGRVMALSWSPDGSMLASAAQGDDVHLWDSASGKRLRSLGCDPSRGSPVLSWSPDGKFLAVHLADYSVKVYEVSNSDLRGTFNKEQQVPSTTLGWTPDSKTLISYGMDRTVRSWDLASGHSTHSQLLTAQPNDRPLDTLSADGRLLAATGGGFTFRVWETDTGRPRNTVVVLRGATDQYLTITPEGYYRATAELESDLVYVVQTEKGQEMLTTAEFEKRFGWTNKQP